MAYIADFIYIADFFILVIAVLIFRTKIASIINKYKINIYESISMKGKLTVNNHSI